MTKRLTANDLRHAYGRHTVLRGVTFSCEAGQAVGVIGPNGAGKTTLLRTLVGLVRPHGGWVSIDGVAVPAALSSTRVAYFAGESAVPPAMRVDRWRRLFLGARGARDSRRTHQLSRGTRQLLGLRATLAVPGAQLIVLDEPWEGLDPDASRWLTTTLGERIAKGSTVLVSSHRLHDLAAVCDRFVFLDGGTAFSAHARELSETPVTAEALLATFDALRGDPRR